MAKIQNPQDQNGINLVNQETFNAEISRIDTEIDTETQRATDAENNINVTIADLEDNINKKIADLEDKTLNKELFTWDVETSFSDGATNVFKFECDSPISGIITNIRIYCSTKLGAGEPSYLEVRQNNKILGRSINSQSHASGALLNFNFNDIILNLGERYSFHIVKSDGAVPQKSCLALDLKSNVSEVSNLNVQVEGYPNHTTRFGFTYYKKSNINLIDYALNQTVKHATDSNIHINKDEQFKWNSLNVDNLYSKKGVKSVKNKVLTYTDETTEEINPELFISAQYTFRDNSSTPAAGNGASDSEIRPGDYLNNSTLESFNYHEPRSESELGSMAPYAYEHDFDFRTLFPNDANVDDEALYSLYTLTNANGMFVRTKLTTFNDDLSSLLVGDRMFMRCTLLESFRSAVPSLTCARGMFNRCVSLTEFKSKLPSLAWARMMFGGCTGLTTVDTCLPNLVNGDNMFNNCTSLTKFFTPSTSMSNLYYAPYMFNNCPLTNFNGNLESLEYAYNMFNGCKLNVKSLQRVADTIRDWSSDEEKEHILGTIGYGDEVTISDLDEIAKKLKEKRWSFNLSGKAGNISSDSVIID